MSTSFSASLMPAARLATAWLLGVAGAASAQTPNPPPIKIALIESQSGPFANTGEAVFRNLLWATEWVDARGGAKLPGAARSQALARHDSKGQNEEAASALRAAIDDGVNVISQDYSFGLSVAREGRHQITAQNPDISIVGDELLLLDRVNDFTRDAGKIKSSGAQAVLTGNWGNDLTLLINAAKDVDCDGKFCTFYGDALGVPASLADAGVGKVVAVAEWFPNAPDAASAALDQSFRQRFVKPQDDYVHMRMQLVVEAPAQSMEKAGSTDTLAVARQLHHAALLIPPSVTTHQGPLHATSRDPT